MKNRKANAIWRGSGKEGGGMLSSASGALTDIAYTFDDRFGEGTATNPEELIAAAHAGCFAMALAVDLSADGHPPEELRAEAVVSADRVDGKWTLTTSHLTVRGRVPGITATEFQNYAAGAKANCPVSRALNLEIHLTATLEG